MELGGTTVEESVGQGAADTLVKEDEHQSNPDAFRIDTAEREICDVNLEDYH
jgi:hypothetical protein